MEPCPQGTPSSRRKPDVRMVQFVCEKFIKHGWTDDVQLKLSVKWFGFPEKDATWQFASSLPREVLRKY